VLLYIGLAFALLATALYVRTGLAERAPRTGLDPPAGTGTDL
jgi:hypothetical protein